jgi:hypothetical protein
MPIPNRKLAADRRRALAVLADSPNGCTEAIMLPHGFTIDSMVELIKAGFATATVERTIAGEAGRIRDLDRCNLDWLPARRDRNWFGV